tara:strand:+ start:2486 stop:5830 length:3345 start_codon:yes stop_codon:yes gene_type:complete
MNINCFIINLERCPEKRERIIKRMKNYPEIEYEFFDAIDGQEITQEYMEQNKYNVFNQWNDPFHNRKITKGEIGCSLSHYKVYEKATSMKHDITLVLEDDADFSDHFLTEFKKAYLDLKKQRWDMCYLGRKKISENEYEEYIEDSNCILYPSYSYWCIGYLIHKEFCKKIISSNFLQKIIPIDEYLPLIGNISDTNKYRSEYDTEINILSYHKNIIYPEKDAFQSSDTEISTYLPNNTSKLLVISVATDRNEPLQRFTHSCDTYGLRYKILGLDQTWSGGDMKKGPGGGMKLNLLKRELVEYNDEDIILFSDSYDVIFLTNEDEIMNKYNKFKSKVVFAGEKKCWPEPSMSKLFTGNTPYKYINSGGFIGEVKTIREIIDIDFEDSYDDQYLIHTRYDKFRQDIKIDENCEIFQTSSDEINELTVVFQTNRIFNTLTNAKPCHYHGNGGKNTKIRFNNNCNYLLKTWNPMYQYRMPKKEYNGKSIYLFIFNKYNIQLDNFLQEIERIDYPKQDIHIHLFTDQEIKHTFSEEYHSINIQKINDKEHFLRDQSLQECKKYRYDYYLNIDPICQINDKNIIYELLSYDKKIVCPLLRLGDKGWSNFWGDIDDYGWYNESFNYFDILNYRQKGCWNVPYINHIYLIDSEILDIIRDNYTIGYQSNRGCDMSFCENCYHKNIFLHLCNEKKYGELLDPKEFETSIKEEILEIEDQLQGDIMVIDNILEQKIIDQLRGFAITADFNTSHNYKGGYQDLGFDSSNFPIPELNEVVQQLEEDYHNVLEDLEFDRGWFFIYNNECPGVTPHADPASVNINIWLTPDSSVKDETKNGLIIWDKKRPSNWSYQEYNKDINKIQNYLTESNATKQMIEYKYNRGMIFDSSYFHETNGVSMKDGHWNKRINLVFMFKPKQNKLTLFDYEKDKTRYLEKYFHREFIESIQNLSKLTIDEPITDVLQFPIVNDIFCKELIRECEKYGKWSGATNEDERIGYENIPSNDIHFTEIKFNEIWETLIKEYIAPIVSYHWGSFRTEHLNIGFVVKYEHDKFYQLGPHHDSSAYTINIALNDDYEGGEVRFIKKNKQIKNKKGYALIHPGRITHYHEGLPVTKGTKYVCVSFVN